MKRAIIITFILVAFLLAFVLIRFLTGSFHARTDHFSGPGESIVIYKYNWGDNIGIDAEPVKELINEAVSGRYGFTVDVKAFPGTEYGQKLEVDLAVGEPIDAFLLGENELGYWYSRGNLIDPLNADIELHAPELKAAFPEDIWKQVSHGNRILGIPSYGEPFGSCIVVRQDILDRYELELPETLEELEEISARLLVLDPGIVPISGAWWDFANILCPALGIDKWDATVIDDEKEMIYSGNKSPDFYRYTAKLSDWKEAGYLDQDFLSSDFEMMKEMFLTGRNVFTFNNLERTNDWSRELDDLRHTGEITIIPELNGQGYWSGSGEVPQVLILPSFSGKRAHVLQYLNWLFEDSEHYTLASLGIEGRHYQVNEKGFFRTGDTRYANLMLPVFHKDYSLPPAEAHPSWYRAREVMKKTKWNTDPLKGHFFLDPSLGQDFPDIGLFDQEWWKYLDGRLESTPDNYHDTLRLYFENGGTTISREYYRLYRLSQMQK